MSGHQDGNYFITLTYDNEHLPYPTDNGKTKVQKWMKRFRKQGTQYGLNPDFKYYIINELGEKHGRLHYHGILCHTELSWDTLRELITKTWKQGRIDLRHIIPARVKYVTKYCLQNIAKPRPYWKYVGNSRYKVYPEPFFFMLVSQGMGVGGLDEDTKRYIRDHEGQLPFEGRKVNLPKYLNEKAYESKECVEFHQANSRRLAAALNDTEEYFRQSRQYFEMNPNPTTPPDFIKELHEKARQVEKYIKKCNFIQPPSYENFKKQKESETRKS